MTQIAFRRAGGKPSRDSDRQGASNAERVGCNDSWRPLGVVSHRVLAEVAPVVAPNDRRTLAKCAHHDDMRAT
jgi:hypothetical protein